LGFCLAVGDFVYPACWYCLIFRYGNYSLAQTAALVTCTFLLSCVLVAVAFFGWGIWAVFIGMAPFHLQSSSWLDVLVLPCGAMALTIIIGSTALLIPYILIVFPIAYLQRYLLLQVFGYGAS
jgi:hypothetical protein